MRNQIELVDRLLETEQVETEGLANALKQIDAH